MKESMIIYESAYKAINYLPNEKLQLEAFKGLMEYGFYGTVPKSENPFVNMVYVQAIPSMRNAKERYDASVENGRKGGRPAVIPIEDILQMKQDGMTNKQIAERLGCSEKNIEKRVSTYNRSSPTNPTNPPTNPTSPDGGAHPTNPTNLTVSVSDTVSESVSLTESSSVSSIALADNNCIEDQVKGASAVGADKSPERKDKSTWIGFISGDGKPGRRIRDLSDEEAKEIKVKISKGLRYFDLESEYGMRHGTITDDFEKYWQMFVVARANGKVKD